MVLCIIAVIVLCFAAYAGIRNTYVLSFTLSIVDGGFGYLEYLLDSTDTTKLSKEDAERFWAHYREINDKVDQIIHKHSYERFLFSFKPLKLDRWFTAEEINILTKHYKQHGKR